MNEKIEDRRKLAAIMFTDMVGYSSLAQRNESLALTLLEEHRRILRSLFPKNNGKEIETAGDAFFAEFASALEAVQCATEIQKTLFDRNASMAEEKQIIIRIGVHLGDVVVRGKNVLGDGVNIAARIEPLAEPGGICISEDVARQVRNKIELPLHKLGSAQLKNIQLPMGIYAIELPWMKKPAQTDSVTFTQHEAAVNTLPAGLMAKSKLFKVVGVGIGLFLTAIIVGILIRSDDQKEDTVPRWTELVHLTTQPGLEDEPSWSPDGRSLAYVSDEGGYLSFWIRQIEGERGIRVGKEGIDEAQPAWSPDGKYIAFVSSRDHSGTLGIFLGSRPIESHVYGQNGDLYIMPPLGGTARRLAEDAYDPSWSPDGKKIAFRSIREGRWQLYTVSTDDRKIEPVPGVNPRVIGLSWSPDGKWIAYIGGASAATGWDLYVIPATGGSPSRLTNDKATIALDPTWSRDGRWIFFSSNRGGALNLWRVRFQSDPPGSFGPPLRMTTGIGEDVNPTVSPDGKNIAYSTVHTAPDIWQVDLATSRLMRLTSETTIEDYPRFSPDGNRLLFYSDRKERIELWMMDMKTKEKTRLSRGGGSQNAWSPDGRLVAYGTPQGLKILDPYSGKETTVSEQLATAYPAFSPDGKEVCFQGRDVDQYRLYRASLSGGDPSVVNTPEGEPGNPSYSKDGKTIFYQLDQFGYRNIWTTDLNSGESRQISTGNTDDAHPDVSPDGQRIMFLRNHRDLYVLPINGGEPELVFAFKEHNRLIEFPAWTHDGRGIVFSISDKTGDIFLLQSANQTFVMP
jgi:Tol biopolymer transport system component/class 3 adenylate cyclase